MKTKLSLWLEGEKKTIAALRTIGIYGSANFKTLDVETDQLLLTTRLVIDDRLEFAKKLIAQYLKAGFQPFAPVSLSNGNITPVIAEKSNGKLFVVYGCHRAFASILLRLPVIRVLTVEPHCEPSLPCQLFTHENVRVVESVQHWTERFSEIDEDSFRPIAEAIANSR